MTQDHSTRPATSKIENIRIEHSFSERTTITATCESTIDPGLTRSPEFATSANRSALLCSNPQDSMTVGLHAAEVLQNIPAQTREEVNREINNVRGVIIHCPLDTDVDVVVGALDNGINVTRARCVQRS